MINIRWAHVDPNPLARQHEERQQQLEFINAVQVGVRIRSVCLAAERARAPQSKIDSVPVDQIDKKRSILTLQVRTASRHCCRFRHRRASSQALQRGQYPDTNPA